MWQFSWKSEKTIFDTFFKTFFTNRGKNGDDDEKIWQNVFSFWILHIKLGYVVIFMKIGEHFFWLHLRHFWLIETKIKMKMKKIGIMSLIFEFSISKLGFKELFKKIWDKMLFSRFLPGKDILGQRWRKG